MSESISAFQAFPQLLGTWLTEHAQAVWWYTALVRFLFPILALLVLVRAIRGLLRVPHTPEQWGQLSLPGGGSLPIDHWENILGRSSSADIRLNFSTVSRQHAALLRDESGSWWVTDLGSKGGTQVNGVQVSQRTPIRVGDTLTVGGVDLLFLPLSREEGEQLSRRRQEEAPLPMWPSLLWLTLFQLLAALQLAVSAGASVSPSLFLLFPGLPTVMWTYYLALRRCGARGFEMETIAFFLSTLSLAVTASSAPGSVLKQFIAILLGLTALVVLGVWLRDSMAGIGTLTFYDPATGVFAGLGHGICDMDTNGVMALRSGEPAPITLSGIVKGQADSPGQLRGYFSSEESLGTLLANRETGVYGTLHQAPAGEMVETLTREEVATGPVQLLVSLDETGPQLYEAEIQEIINRDKTTKNLVVQVTDPRLLERTGGIVQGMSGAPILQNGKLAGAITHVFTEDPTLGYGIFISNMLEGMP